MELELTYKEFIENSNIIDSYWHYSELTEYINENFYKLPYTVSDVYMEEEEKKDGPKMDLMKGLGKVGNLVGSTLSALFKSLWNMLVYIFQMVLRFISFMLKSIAGLLDFLSGKELYKISEDIKKNLDMLQDREYFKDKSFNVTNNKLWESVKEWFKPFEEANLGTKWEAVTDKDSWTESTNDSYINDEYFTEETSAQNIDKLLKIVKFYEYQKELTKENYQKKAAIIILLNNLINSNIVLTLVNILKLFINNKINAKSSIQHQKNLIKNEPDEYMGKGYSANTIKPLKENDLLFPDLIKNLSNIQNYSKTLNISICSKKKMEKIINRLINSKQSKIDIVNINNELTKIVDNIYKDIENINRKFIVLHGATDDLTKDLSMIDVILKVQQNMNKSLDNKFINNSNLKDLKEIYNKNIDQVKNISKDFKKYSSQLGDLAKIKEIKFMTTTIKSLIPNIKMTNDYILEYQKTERAVATSIKTYKQIHKSIQSIAKMNVD